MKKFSLLVLIAVLMLSFAAPAFATDPKDKLFRGAANVFSSLLEVPQNIDIEWKKSNNAGVGIFTGLFKGFFWGVARLSSGVWDVVTFPFPKPSGYNSIIQPEYVQRGVQTHFLSDDQNAAAK